MGRVLDRPILYARCVFDRNAAYFGEETVGF
jgi:hypothetical protein